MKLQDVLNEAIKPNAQNFQRVRDVQEPAPGDEQQIALYKLLMTLSNLCETVGDFYAIQGNAARQNYYNQLSNRIRSEANSEKRKDG